MTSNLKINHQCLTVISDLLTKEVKKSRELSLTITKIEEAIMWLEKAIAIEQNITNGNPNQGELLFGDNLQQVVANEEPKKYKLDTDGVKVEIVGSTFELESTEKPAEKLPSKEEVIFMAKEYSKKHGSGEAFLKVLETFGATKISEVYAKGDDAVRNLVNSIRI